MTLTYTNLLLLVVIKKINFSIFRKLLNFPSAISNGEIILKEAEIK